MLWEKLAENRIQEAIETGELTPPPAGTVLDLEAYFSAPVEERMALGLLKSADVIPPEVELLKQIARLEAELEANPAPERAAVLRSTLQTQRVQFAMIVERRKRMGREP